MYMEELSRHFRQQSGNEVPEDTPVDGDIADMDDLGVTVQQVN